MKLSDLQHKRVTRLSNQIVVLEEVDHPGVPAWDRMAEQYPAIAGMAPYIGKKPLNLQEVHSWFRSHFIYQPDRPGKDVWRPVAKTWEWTALPGHNFAIGVGDCEDYALTVRGYLRGMYRCRMARCRIMPRGTPHAALLAIDDAGMAVVDVRYPTVRRLDDTIKRHWWSNEYYQWVDCYDPRDKRWKWMAHAPSKD